MSKTDLGLGYSDAALDAAERGGGLWLALGFAVMLVAAALGLALFRPTESENLVVGLLLVLAVVGVFSIFALAVGTVRIGAAPRDDLARAVLDGAPEAIAVLDAEGRILRANRRYLELLGESEPRSPERALSRDRDAAEAVYRLAQAARSGRPLDEEVRLLKRPDGRDGPAWFRIRVAPLQLRDETVTVWTIADATAEREKHENAFQELQQAIDYLEFEARPGKRVPLAISVGAAVFPHDGDTYVSLLAQADSRMYRDKNLRKQARVALAATGTEGAADRRSVV